MRGFLIFLGLLLLIGGGAVAGAQYAPIDLSTIQVLDQVPGAREFLMTQNALYVGAGFAGFGLLLMIIAAVTGGKPKERPVVKPPSMAPLSKREPVAPPAPSTAAPAPLKQQAPQPVAPQAPAPPPQPAAAPKPTSQPVAAAPAPPTPQPAPAQPTPPPPSQPAATPPPRPVAATPPPQPAAPVSQTAPAPKPTATPQTAVPPAPQPAAAATPEQKAKPQASAQPPAGVAAVAPQPVAGAPPPDPRMINRKRVQDLVTINDAVKAYHKKNGAYPKAEGLAGANERGAAWIPGLTPEFLAEIPRDPLHAVGTQYVYVSDGANYKLLAQGASLVGSGNVEVLGIKIDQTRNPTPQNAAFGFWTPDFASA